MMKLLSAASSAIALRSRASDISIKEPSTTSLPDAASRSITAGMWSAMNGARLEHTTSPTTTLSIGASSAIRK